jgi:hypothetical protein
MILYETTTGLSRRFGTHLRGNFAALSAPLLKAIQRSHFPEALGNYTEWEYQCQGKRGLFRGAICCEIRDGYFR